MQHRIGFVWSLLGAIALSLAGCGGGSGAGPDFLPAAAPRSAAAVPVLPVQAASAAAQQVSDLLPDCRSRCILGTAAVGAAFAQGMVVVTDRSGANACEEATASTGVGGAYACNVRKDATAPFFIVVTDPRGSRKPVVGVATAMPLPGRPSIANATTLTTAILASLDPGHNPLALVAGGQVDTDALAARTKVVLTQIAPVLSALGMGHGYDPFTTPIIAATPYWTGSKSDAVLDVVEVRADVNGAPALSTIGSTNAVSVGGTEQLSAPAAGVLSLVPAVQRFASILTRCFALATGERVIAQDVSVPASQGGPTVTEMAPVCRGFTASAANGAGVDFLHNGYTAGQFFYAILTSDAMTNASFALPQPMLYLPAAQGRPDRVVLQFRYVDNTGHGGSFIVVADLLANAPVPGWWIDGNGEPIDVLLRPVIRRVEQLHAGWPPGHFQSGFQPQVNALGPNSIVGGQPMSAARISGPGLPVAGLVFVAPSASEVNQNYMDLSNVTGEVQSAVRCGGQFVGNCPLFWMEQTAGLTGPAASQLAPNPPSFIWLQPGTQVIPGAPTRGAIYTIEVFYGGSTTPAYTFRKAVTADNVPATAGASLQWNGLGTTSRALLDPANTAYNGTLLSAVTIDWTQNPLAEQVAAATMSLDYRGTLATSIPAAPGASSVSFPPRGTPPLTEAADTNRMLLFSYRMGDGSAKSALYRYN